MKRRIVLWIVIGTIVVVIAGVLVWGTYVHDWSWTGIGPEPALSGHVPISIGQTSKTLWDFLQLLGGLAVPAVVAVAAARFTTGQQLRAEQDAYRREQEAVLETYLGRMGDLLLHENLLESGHAYHDLSLQGKPVEAVDDRVQDVARTQTLTALRRLDGGRKAAIVQFLYESSLIDKDRTCVDLREANLYKANLYKANLRGAHLRGAHLSKAFLMNADLREANLRDADLRDADLSDADLSDTVLSGADLRDADLSDPVLRGADLRGAVLRGAVLSGADLRGAVLSGAVLRGTDLSGADLSGADLRGADGLPDAPVVPNIDAAILAAVEAGGTLRMSLWHTCGTSHCRGGWAVHLAGDAGYALARKFGTNVAATLIYAASRPGVPVPSFSAVADDDETLADIRACAAAQTSGEARS